MYITIDDGENELKIMYEDINDITNESWQLWRINLQSLGLCSEDMAHIDMSHIETLSISIERDPNTTIPSGYGTIYFDDIVLYPSRCLPENKPEPDFNGDCIVDFIDFSELAYNWLESGYNIYHVEQPKNNPLFWYEFENNLLDTSGNAHGDFSGNGLYFVPGVYGNAIKFDEDASNGSVFVNNVSDYIAQIDDGISITFWQKGAKSSNQRDTLFCTDYYYNEYENKQDPSISINLGCWDKTGIYNWDCGTHLPYDRRLSGTHRYREEWENQWNHWAFTKDLETGVMQVFLNGILKNTKNDSSNEISLFNSFTIGTGWYGDYDGLMDDLRIYDYALSQPEIAYVATNGTGIFDLPFVAT
jgi:hypothetical protein